MRLDQVGESGRVGAHHLSESKQVQDQDQDQNPSPSPQVARLPDRIEVEIGYSSVSFPTIGIYEFLC